MKQLYTELQETGEYTNTSKRIFMSKEIITPRKYISWSQLQLFEKSPSKYAERYLEGIPLYPNKYLRLGKKLATRLETGKNSGNDLIEHVALMIPTYQHYEYKIEIDYKGIPLLMKLDCFTTRQRKLGEVKTGKKWTQRMVDKLDQLTFYATGVWLKFGVLPKKIFLHWAETKEDKNGKLRLTGKTKTFETTRTLVDIVRFRIRIKNAWEGIQALSKEYA